MTDSRGRIRLLVRDSDRTASSEGSDGVIVPTVPTSPPHPPNLLPISSNFNRPSIVLHQQSEPQSDRTINFDISLSDNSDSDEPNQVAINQHFSLFLPPSSSSPNTLNHPRSSSLPGTPPESSFDQSVNSKFQTAGQVKRRLSFIKPSALIPSTSPLINSVKRHVPRSNSSSTDRLQSCEETDRPPRGIKNFVLNRMRRKSSQRSDSTDFEPQSDLITASPNVGIGTRPVDEPSGPALGDEIGLSNPNDVSEIGSASDDEERSNESLDGNSVSRDGSVAAPSDVNMLSPTHYNRSAQPSGGRTLSNLKGALVKKIPRGSKSQSAVNSSDEKQQPKALSSTSGNVSNSTEDSQGHQKCRKKKAPLGLGRRSKSDYSLRAGIDGVGDVVGLCFIEVNRASGLPYWKAVTRIGFDMDPFVIISFGEKIFRTRVIRHCLDPVWDEKMFFHVRQHETAYSILFNVFDWDKMSSNDYIGQSEVLLEDLIKENQTKMKLDQETALYEVDEQGKLVGDYMSNFELPIVSSQATGSKPISKDSSSASQEEVFNGKLSIKAKFTPYSALRQLFWRKYLEQFDTDDSGTISNVELVSMLDSLGSTLTQETISDFFSRYGKSAEADGDVLSFEQVICCLESELIKPPEEKRRINISDEQIGVGQAAAQRQGTLVEDDSDNSDKTQMSSSADLSFVGYGAKGEFVTKAKSNPNPVVESDGLDPTGEQSPETQNPIESQPRLRLEKVVNISRCPICHKQRIGSRMEIDLVTHMAVCASQDWSTLQNILSPGNFVTSSQAHRKWFTKVIGKVQNGRYSLGADSANIIVQDRRSGQLIEEKMQAYVRLGIRLMYKSGGSKDRMQTQRMKKLLKSLTIKQGVKFDSPDSVKEIRPFIAFHGLDLEEVKLPLQEFKTFNEFFYRELKPGARPIEAAGDPRVLVSCADCRMMVFDDLHQSRKVWIKSREFSLEKLLGSSALSLSSRGCSTQPELTDDKRWALAIFRLAPQDYHRFHAPIDGVVEEIEHINGQYYTVNPMAIRSTIDVYGENVRIVVTIQTEKFGKAYCVFVGAMMVGSINTCLKVGDRVKKGDDVGYFAFGGSTILTLFKSDKIRWDEDLRTNSNNSIETLVRVGNRVGAATS